MAKLNLLRLIKVICESCGQNNGSIIRSDLHRTVELLSRQDDAVLVRQVSRAGNTKFDSPLTVESPARTRNFSLVGWIDIGRS